MAQTIKAKPKRKDRRVVLQGMVHIQSTFNNTIVSACDPQGQVIAWASAGTVGFKGAKKGTPFAAQQAAEAVAKRSMIKGCVRLKFWSKDLVLVAKPLFVLYKLPVLKLH